MMPCNDLLAGGRIKEAKIGFGDFPCALLRGVGRDDRDRWLGEDRQRRRDDLELAFAKLKTILRAEAARTVTDLWSAIRRAFRRFTPDECRNYLAAAGYDAYGPT